MIDELSWEDFRTLLAIERAGSLNQAARSMELHTATIARRLDAIEQRVGHVLFDRSTHPLTIEEHGVHLIEAASKMELLRVDALERMRNSINEMAGPLAVGLPDASVASLLMPVLAAFFREHPEIEPTMVTHATTLDGPHMVTDLARRQLDVIVLVHDTPPPDLFGRRLLVPEYRYFGTEAHATRQDPALVGWRRSEEDLSYLPDPADAERVAYRVDTMLTMLDAAAHGLGAAWLPVALAHTRPGLIECVGTPTKPGPAVWVLCLPSSRSIPRVRALMAFLADVLAG